MGLLSLLVKVLCKALDVIVTFFVENLEGAGVLAFLLKYALFAILDDVFHRF